MHRERDKDYVNPDTSYNMNHNTLKRVLFTGLLWIIAVTGTYAQTFKVIKGDTLNRTGRDSLRTGLWREHYFDGRLKRETLYKEGLRNGLDLEYYDYPNCLKTEANYRNDTLHGVLIQYYRNCNIRSTMTMVNGKIEGYYRTYHTNGKLEAEGYFKNGELQGVFAVYDRKGKLRFESTSPETEAGLEAYLTGEKKVKDSVILKILDDIHINEKTVIVTDVTGSMYPYVGQLLLWYRLRMDSSKARYFAFFNDGDNKLDMRKVVGETGGVYYCKAKTFKDLQKTMALAISNGGGGDMQENDLEGVIKAIHKFKNTTHVILIADRTSPVRDMVLLSKIKVPVDVVLCGTGAETHIHYLEIAQKTGGNVYALDMDKKGIRNLYEGEKLIIGKRTFLYKVGRFRRVGR